MNKSTLQEIQQRFDNDVERFCDLNTGQISTIDSILSLELMTQAAATVCSNASSILDLGCGAGNYTLKLLQMLPNLDCTLLDLSKAMLNKASERISPMTNGTVKTIQTHFMKMELPENQFDIILSGAAIHHLREDKEWETVFSKIYKSLKKGGCFFISDLIIHNHPLINQLMWKRYASYLQSIGSKEYQENVFAYIEKEDTPRSIIYQLDLMRKIGFSSVDILHKNSSFAVFGGIK